MKKKYKWITLIAFLLIFLITAYQQNQISDAINKFLLSYLISTDTLPSEKTFDAVYILGGNQKSLRAKYKTTASICAGKRCKKIIILDRPGITEYNPALHRNLTNNEWSFLILENYGIDKKDLQTLIVEPGFFGTYTEAKCVSEYAIKKSWKSLLLITSPEHTKRVRKSFNRFLGDSLVEVRVVASKYKAGLYELLVELFKFKVYQSFLLN